MPAGSGVTYGAYGYSRGGYGVGDSGTFGYGVRPSHLRLRRALWIFQPQTTTRSPQQPNIPTTLPPAQEQSTYPVTDDKELQKRILAAIDEARTWHPPRSTETRKTQVAELKPDTISKAYDSEKDTDKDGKAKQQLGQGFQDLVEGIRKGTLRNLKEIVPRIDSLVSASETTLPKTRNAIREYLGSAEVFTILAEGTLIKNYPGVRDEYLRVFGEVIKALQ
jgi:hypothetical protein